MTVTINLTEQRIADLLCTALEGGSDYWISSMTVHPGRTDGKPYGNEYTPDYIAAPFATDGYVELDPGEGEPIVRLDRAALEHGLNVMAKEFPDQFSEFLKENDDAETGDVFLQCCVFGKVVFG